MDPSEALGAGLRTNEVVRVELGNVIGMQGFWKTAFGAGIPTLRLDGVYDSLQYIGLEMFVRFCGARTNGDGDNITAVGASRGRWVLTRLAQQCMVIGP